MHHMPRREVLKLLGAGAVVTCGGAAVTSCGVAAAPAAPTFTAAVAGWFGDLTSQIAAAAIAESITDAIDDVHWQGWFDSASESLRAQNEQGWPFYLRTAFGHVEPRLFFCAPSRPTGRIPKQIA